MTATAVSEFKKLLARIPHERFKHVWFIPLWPGSKRPGVKNTGWKDESVRLSVRDSMHRLKQGANVAVIALNGGLMFLDIDVEKGALKASLELLKEIPETFMIQSRNGGYQFYFLNDGMWNNQLFKLLSKEKSIKADDLIYDEIGELRTEWQYVVSPGSYVLSDENNAGGDGRYRVISDKSIAKFEGDITKYFQKRDTVKQEATKELSETEKLLLQASKVRTLEEHQKELAAQGKISREISAEKRELLLWQIKNRIW